MSHKLTVLPFLIKHTPKHREVSAFNGSLNVYAFDLDHTIIKPATAGSRFSRTAEDWKFISYSPGKTTLDKLFEIVQDDPLAQIVIFSNQGGVVCIPPNSKSCTKYTKKIELILDKISALQHSDLLLDKIWIYASPKKPASLSQRKNVKRTISNTKESLAIKVAKPSFNGNKKVNEYSIIDPEIFGRMRKPEIGMMEEFKKDLQAHFEGLPNITWCHYCGDAAGRPNDFSDSDKQFAKNLDLTFKTPEDIFG